MFKSLHFLSLLHALLQAFASQVSGRPYYTAVLQTYQLLFTSGASSAVTMSGHDSSDNLSRCNMQLWVASVASLGPILQYRRSGECLVRACMSGSGLCTLVRWVGCSRRCSAVLLQRKNRELERRASVHVRVPDREQRQDQVGLIDHCRAARLTTNVSHKQSTRYALRSRRQISC